MGVREWADAASKLTQVSEHRIQAQVYLTPKQKSMKKKKKRFGIQKVSSQGGGGAINELIASTF